MATSTLCPQCGASLGPDDRAAGRCPSCGATDVAPRRICCMCGVDLTGKPRVKDREGHYYCVACNQADADRIRAARVPCADCNVFFPKDKLLLHGKDWICQPCRLKRLNQYRATKARMASLGAADVRSRNKRLAILGSILVILALISLWVWIISSFN